MLSNAQNPLDTFPQLVAGLLRTCYRHGKLQCFKKSSPFWKFWFSLELSQMLTDFNNIW